MDDIQQDSYQFEPVKTIRNEGGVTHSFIWHARDAIMLKALSFSFTDRLQASNLPKTCTHLKGNGSIYLEPLDHAMESLPIKYVRYMDDWIILAKTPWQLKKAIKKCNQILNALKLEKAPDKTLIARTDKTLALCGFRFNAEGVVDLASKTKKMIQKTVSGLYEQSQKLKLKSVDPVKRYIKTVEG